MNENFDMTKVKLPKGEHLEVQYAMTNGQITYIATHNAVLGKYILYTFADGQIKEKVSTSNNPYTFDNIVFGKVPMVETSKSKCSNDEVHIPKVKQVKTVKDVRPQPKNTGRKALF